MDAGIALEIAACDEERETPSLAAPAAPPPDDLRRDATLWVEALRESFEAMRALDMSDSEALHDKANLSLVQHPLAGAVVVSFVRWIDAENRVGHTVPIDVHGEIIYVLNPWMRPFHPDTSFHDGVIVAGNVGVGVHKSFRLPAPAKFCG